MAPAPRAPIEAAPEPAAAAAVPQLESVEAPGALIMHVRWRRPAETLAAIERLVGSKATPADDLGTPNAPPVAPPGAPAPPATP